MENKRSVSRFKCYFDGENCDKGGTLHHFPQPKYPHIEKFNLWKKILHETIQERGDIYIYNQVRLCGNHFEPCYRSSSNRLTYNAIPTLWIKEKDTHQSTSSTSAEGSSVPTEHIISNVHQPLAECPTLLIKPSTSHVGELVTGNLLSVHLGQPAADPKALNKKIQYKSTSDVSKKYVKNYENLMKKLEIKVKKLVSKCKTQKKMILAAKKISMQKSFLKAIENMPETTKKFTLLQLKSRYKSKGRRFSIDEKIIALTILKQSHKAYNMLRKLIVLPSKRSLQNLLSTFSLQTGINQKILENLKNVVKNLPIEKRLFTILFDEVALSPGLYYSKGKKEIVGFEDFGDVKTKKIADHALVFMVKGIKTKTKQPVLFTFCQSTTKTIVLKRIFKNTIQQLTEAGLIIIASICDQASVNVSLIRSLQKETKEKYLKNDQNYKTKAIEIGDIKFFPLFDIPHLLKGVRNNFLTKNIKFTQNGKEKVAKWEHLQLLLNEDKGDDEIRLLNKLTEFHINKDKIPKMKVKYAAQVFSQRVSAAMRFLAKHKIIPPECEETADLLLLFDKLFDSFNGHSYHDTAKPLKGCLKNNSPHFQFWTEILPILRSIVFEKRNKKDNVENIQFEKIPSVQNWIHNIETFLEMWTYLKENYDLKNLITRNFNQDPLENFFCCIRSNGVRNINPTCIQFINAYKTLLINNFSSPHSISANCENDENQLLQSLNYLLSEKNYSPDTGDYACNIDSLLCTLHEIKTNNLILNIESKKYVAGYIIKKCKSKLIKNCKCCSDSLIDTEIDNQSFNYMIDYTKKSLFYARDDFVKLLNEIYYMIVTCLKDSPEIPDLKKKIIFFINCRCDFSIISCKKHRSELISYIIDLSINLIVNSWCVSVNRILIGKVINFDLNDAVKLQAHNYYKSRRKK